MRVEISKVQSVLAPAPAFRGLTSWWGMQVQAQTAVLQGYVLGWQRAEVSGSGEGGGHQKVNGNLQGAVLWCQVRNLACPLACDF